MKLEDIRAIIIGLITTGIGNLIAYARIYLREEKRKENPVKHTKRYIKQVKTEFYVSIAFAILFILLPTSKYEFIRTSARVLSVFSLSFSVMAFMCMVEEYNAIKKEMTDSTTDNTVNDVTNINK